jgi:hypothetical protein
MGAPDRETWTIGTEETTGMPFGLFEGKAPQLTVTMDRPHGPYYPGDTITLTITLVAEKDTKLREVRASLLRRQKVQTLTQTEDTTTHEKKITPSWQSSEKEVEKQVPMHEGSIHGTQTFTVELHIPPDAAPVYTGPLIENKWIVKVTADRAMASDADQEIELPLIVVPTGQHGGAGQYGTVNNPGDAGLRLDLSKLDWANGETLTGTLQVQPNKDFEAREIRLALLCTETVPSPVQVNTQETTDQQQQLAGATQFHAGQAQSFPFTLSIAPKGHPPGATWAA